MYYYLCPDGRFSCTDLFCDYKLENHDLIISSDFTFFGEHLHVHGKLIQL